MPDIIGRPHEVTVYHIDNDYLDCHYEHQLHLAMAREEDTIARRRYGRYCN